MNEFNNIIETKKKKFKFIDYIYIKKEVVKVM